MKKENEKKYRILLNDIESGKFKNTYLLYGNEPYFTDQITDAIINNCIDAAGKDFNETILYGRDVEAGQIIEHAKRFPMMAERQLVLIKEAQNIKNLTSLEQYMKAPTPTTVLVLAFKNKKPDGKTKWVKAAKKAGDFFESEAIRDYQMMPFVEQIAASKKRKIDKNAAELLATYLGENLSKVVNAVEKLCIVVEPNTTITTAHIEKNIGISKDYNIFEFQKALGTKNILKANTITKYYIDNPKAHPLQMIIPSLYGYFTKLMICHQAGNNNSSLATALRLPPFLVQEYKTASSLFPPKKLVKIMRTLRDTDAKSKGVGNDKLPSGALLKEMVFKILH